MYRSLRKNFSASKRQVVEYVKLANLLKEAKRYADALKTLKLAIEVLDHMWRNEAVEAVTKDILKKKAITLIIEAKLLQAKVDIQEENKKKKKKKWSLPKYDTDYYKTIPTVTTVPTAIQELQKKLLEVSLHEDISAKAMTIVESTCGNYLIMILNRKYIRKISYQNDIYLLTVL